MKVYLASDFTTKGVMQGFHSYFEQGGCIVTSSWYFVDQNEPEVLKATRDIAELEECDAIVIFLEVPNTRHGKFLEMGYAIARDKIVIVVGKLEYDLAFLHLPNVVQVVNHCVAVKYLQQVESIRRHK